MRAVAVAAMVAGCHPRPQCPSPPDSEVYRARHDAVGAVYIAMSDAPFSLEHARQTCGAADPILAPLCFEGVADSYAQVIAKAARERDPHAADLARNFEVAMAEADTRWTAIHCRGLESVATLPADVLEPLVSLFSPRCRAFLAEVAAPDRFPPSADVADAHFRKQAWTAHCAALGASWHGVQRASDRCAFGVGRTIGNVFPGHFEHGAELCLGAYRGGCLAGIGFVATYLYPDQLGRALALARTLTGGDRAAYLEGVANALQWRARSDAELMPRWLASLSAHDARLVGDIRREAERCGLVDYGQGVGCTWPDPEVCP